MIFSEQTWLEQTIQTRFLYFFCQSLLMKKMNKFHSFLLVFGSYTKKNLCLYDDLVLRNDLSNLNKSYGGCTSIVDCRTLFWWPSCSTLPIDARCSDDLAAAHYWLALAVPMTYPQCTNDWRMLFRSALLIAPGPGLHCGLYAGRHPILM